MKETAAAQQAREGAISIIGPGMRVTGDCTTDGTLRVEGVIEGTVHAGKAVVVGKDGVVLGDVTTQDAVIGGRVVGTVTAESRLELQATCIIEGEVRAKRIKLEEGGRVNGNVHVGDAPVRSPAATPEPAVVPADEEAVPAES
jgi:cytoskeletal protein CcmA (bactofilin family)